MFSRGLFQPVPDSGSAGKAFGFATSGRPRWQRSLEAEPERPNSNFPEMARYFFNFRVDDCLIPDPEGEELEDLQHAIFVAKRAGGKLAAEQINSGKPLLSLEIVVTDETGVELLSVPLVEVVH
jgi:hypothetical protein